MTHDHSYNTIEKSATAEFKDRGSKFLAYAYPIQTVDEFKARLSELKKEHPKAVHHCFAYRIGTDRIQFRTSDDGEPSGTAGKPILGQIDSKELTNILIVVVRYFGGTLLGVPGLINAYKTSAAMALEQTAIIKKDITKDLKIQFDYSLINEIMMILKKFDCEIQKREMGLFCVFEVKVPIRNFEQSYQLIKSLKGVEIVS